jgi:hypothetical protein
MSANGDHPEQHGPETADGLFRDPYVVPSAETANNLTAARHNGRAESIDRWLKERIAQIPKKPNPKRGDPFTDAPEASQPET